MGKASRRKRERKESPEQRSGVERHPDGSRTVRLGDGPGGRDLLARLEEQRERFRAKFGRDMGPNDPLIFDPDADEPRPLPATTIEAQVAAAMERAGIDPAFVYAFQHTGLIPTEANRHLLSEEDSAEFAAAVERYRALHGDGDGGGADDDET